MSSQQIERELKLQINSVDKKLKRMQKFQSAACFGSAIGLGVVLSHMTEHVVLLLAIAILGVLVNVTVNVLSSKKHLSS